MARVHEGSGGMAVTRMGCATNSSRTGVRAKTTPVDFDPFSQGELAAAAPATEAQKEIWLAAQMGPEANCAFNESIGIWLHGAIDMGALRSALRALVGRHDALRSVMTPEGDRFCVLRSGAAAIDRTDASHAAGEEQGRLLDAILAREVTTPFDLTAGPLFRAQTVKLHGEKHCLILTAHHVVCDGWSWGVILGDLVELYSAAHAGRAAALAPVESYGAYAFAESSQMASPETRTAQKYWIGRLSDAGPATGLPADQPRPRRRSFHAARQEYHFSADLVTQLKRLGARHNCTLFATLLGGFALFLHRATGKRDILVGITAAGQLSSGRQNLVGHCANLLPFRTSIDPAAGFAQYVRGLHGTLLDAYEHERVTLGWILKNMTFRRDPIRPPLLAVRFNLARGIGARVAEAHGVRFEMFTNPRKFEIFELFLDAMETEDGLALECYYNTDLFSAQGIRTRLQEFEALLRRVVETPGEALGSLPGAAPAGTVHPAGTLPREKRSGAADAGAEPRPADAIELQLIAIWQRLLNVPHVGLSDDFFELGGNSYLAVALCRAIERELGRQLGPAAIFEAPTIRELAEVLRVDGDRVAPVAQESAAR